VNSDISHAARSDSEAEIRHTLCGKSDAAHRKSYLENHDFLGNRPKALELLQHPAG
jgi:hypothetical protein